MTDGRLEARRQSIRLLWSQDAPSRPGPKPKLSIDRIVEAAIRVADAEGLDAISIRRVSKAVGLSPMALYTYVSNKSDLVELMLDYISGEVANAPADAPWRQKLEFVACERHRLGLRHCWMLQVSTARQPLGSNGNSVAEPVLEILEPLGLGDAEMHQVMRLMNGYVAGATRDLVLAHQASERSGRSETEWGIASRQASRDSVGAPSSECVAGSSARQVQGSDAENSIFRFGLDRVLDGIEAYVSYFISSQRCFARAS